MSEFPHWDEIEYNRGYIYVIARSDGYFKIGRTRYPCSRFYQHLWTAEINGWIIEPVIISYVNNYATAEELLHNIFSEKRISRRLGPKRLCRAAEWFRLDTDDIIKIYELLYDAGYDPIYLEFNWNVAREAAYYLEYCTDINSRVSGE